VGADEESKADFAVVLFVGLIVHGLFAEYLNRAPGLILANVNYVKKNDISVGNLAVGCGGLGAVPLRHQCCGAADGPARLSAHAGLDCGIPTGSAGPAATPGDWLAWFLPSIGVFVHDIGQTVGIFATVLLFLSSAF